MKVHDDEFLRAALIGYGQQLTAINAKMDDIRRQLAGRKSNGAAPIGPAKALPRTRQMSPEGRARISAAQKLRWKNARKAAAVA